MKLSWSRATLLNGSSLLLRYLSVMGGLSAFAAITYFGLTSPVLPYSKATLYTVDRVLDPVRAGDIQAQDSIIKFNGAVYYPCMYLWTTPIYSAPRDVPIPVEYARHGVQAVTSIELSSPSIQDAANRLPIYAISFIFILTASIILIGSPAIFPNFLIGAAGLWAGLLLAAGPDISDFNAPLSFFYWLGIPIWGALQVAAHALWPANLWGRWRVRALVVLQGVISLVYVGLILDGVPRLGCYPNHLFLTLTDRLYLVCFGLPFPAILYLLFLAYRSSSDPFVRLRIRALFWSVGLGMGIPLLLSVVPSYLGLPWVLPPEMALLFAGIIPLTYLFAMYRGELLMVNGYLNRVIFVGAFFIFWIIVALTLANAITYWWPNPNAELVAVVATLPPLLLATWVRDRIGLLVDLALYGVHYEYELIVPHLGQALTGVLDEEGLAEVVVRRIPAALLIRQAALWLPAGDGQWRLVDHSARPADRGRILSDEAGAFSRPGNLEALASPCYLAADPTPWWIILRFRANENLIGVAVFGARLRENVYSGKDIQTLTSLASWITTTIVNVNMLAERRAAAERERQLMLKLAEKEEETRRAVAAELHDQGISALGLVRLMVNQKREQALIVAAIERVIKDLRGITSNRLSPIGLDQGLAQALEAMVEKQRRLGLPVSLSVAARYCEPKALSSLARHELYYIAQEAVVNAVKHAEAGDIQVSLAGDCEGMQLAVTDNGKGFDARAMLAGRETRGVGIMQARANRISGRLSIVSQAGCGTAIRVDWHPAS